VRRHGTASRKTVKTRRRKTTKVKPPGVPTPARRGPSSVVDLQEKLGRQARELEEAREEQAATADVLRIISSSPGELEPVFQAILKNATRLCEAKLGNLWLREGNKFRIVAIHGGSQKYRDYLFAEPLVLPDEQSVMGRIAKNREIVHVDDISTAPTYGMRMRIATIEIAKAHTLIGLPMLKDKEVVGIIAIYRQEVRAFTDMQIQLVKNFASQAVIAIENSRLFSEVQAKTRDLSEALTYQTGSSNILSVIASSPTDVAPVLQAIVKSACELCGAYDALVRLKVGDGLQAGAHHGPIPASRDKWHINRNWTGGRAVIDQKPVHVHDVLSAEGDDFPETQEIARHQGYRTSLSVPLLRQGESIGVIVLRRLEVHPFSDKQIALLQTFADQAVIAIGNVRMFDEVQAKTRDLTDSLEQQTATSEVLQIISSSPEDLEPVFAKMLENATRICGANFGQMNLYEDGSFRLVALYNVPAAYATSLAHTPFQPHPQGGLGTVALTRRVVHIEDIRTLPPYLEGNPSVVALADLAGARSVFVVPMLKENELIGAITIYSRQVKPFTERQTELVANFANQAVIAIENARLLNELRERTTQLSRSLDELRTAQDRLVQTEKLASLGQLTAGIAHEIKNPLNFVNNFSALSAELIDEMKEALSDISIDNSKREQLNEITQMLKSNLEKVVQHGKRADSIVKNMLQHSRESSGEHRPAEINAVVGESLNLAYHGARAEKADFTITLERKFDPTVGMVDVYPQEITRALLNLISNGFYATTKRKAEAVDGFEPTLSATTRNLGDKVEIRIRDNGTGIPEEVKEKIFNPFFTTKPSGEGTGLGLSMSHDIIVKQHGGSIDVETEPGLFTEFKIVLPRTNQR
jgi:two-component system NtrC family sensor kinase